MAGALKSGQRVTILRPPYGGTTDGSAGSSIHVTGHESPRNSAQSTLGRHSEELESLSLNPSNASSNTIADEANVLGGHVKEAINAIGRLEGLGLQRMDIPLPRCVVLGEQSTGKSSVIEAISGIQTPRSTDTCTRCPLFIKTEPSADQDASWTAQVKLRLEYKWDGKKKRSVFPGWIPNPNPVEEEFASTNSPKELGDLIARAQAAILSPLQDPNEFKPPNPLHWNSRLPRCEFSPNVVCISVSQPDIPALSFYDLPGIIGQAETDENQYLVKFVKDLVAAYIKDPDSLILVTCSLENDIANSTAAGFARTLKADGRCVGVLTKPDRLPPGSSEDKLLAVMNGSRFALGHGYFVVKNPSQDALNRGLSHQDARIEERRFFASTAPWTSPSFQTYRGRFGTGNLQIFLSGKLTGQVEKMLPFIQAQIEERLVGIEQQLAQLPEPPTINATRIISDIIYAFTEHVQKEMEADYPCREWRNTWESLHRAFYNGLFSMKPTLVTSPAILDQGIFATTGKSPDDAVVIGSDEEEEEGQDVPGPSVPETPFKKRKLENMPTPTQNPTPASADTRQAETPSRRADVKPQGSDFAHLRKPFQLDFVARHLKETSKSKVPGQLQPKVIDDLILKTLEHWKLPMDQFFKDFDNELKKLMRLIFDDHFGKWQGSALYQKAWRIVEDMLGTHMTEQRLFMAGESLKDEMRGPFIFNEGVYNREEAKTLGQYRQARFRTRLKVYARESSALIGKPWTPKDEEKLLKDDRKRALVAEEPYERELAVIARVASYYVIAARRFYENVCMRIESKFFQLLKESLRNDLDVGLGIHDEHNARQNALELLAEPSQRLEQRKELHAMKNALLQGRQVLRDLQEKYNEDSPSQAVDDLGAGFATFGPTSMPRDQEMEDATDNRFTRC